jgi:uncharacterized RDD family membrane protein YckC
VSTRASQLVSQPSWKEEVNRRLAAHQSRKGLSVVEDNGASQERLGVSERAAKAAARVAARFSSAPSYAEMQAAEARAALREAEVATRAALEAQAVAQAALAQLEWIAEEQVEFQAHYAEQAYLEAPSVDSSHIELDYSEPSASASSEMPLDESLHAETPRTPKEEGFVPRAYESSEAHPIHANLIHFPRELVATRRIRPRSSAADLSTEEQLGQLSIFEVDPGSISIEPTASIAEEIAPAPSWSGPEWAGLDLELEREELDDFGGGPPSITARIHLAPLELRLMAAVVDISLIVGLVCAGIAGIAAHLHHAPAMRAAGIGGLAALILIGLVYHAFFLMTTMSTPGMMYAGIGLCTFDDEYPTRAQLRGRLKALLVSLFPVGLGMVWAIFDEDHLSWHDRISRTYLRRRC